MKNTFRNKSSNNQKQKANYPERKFFLPAQIVESFIVKGESHVNRPMPRQFILSINAGAFVAFGAILSVLLSMGVSSTGVHNLLAGIGFASGYAIVFISGAILFTEVNVLLPAYLLQKKFWIPRGILQFWGACYVGNVLGALAVAFLVVASGSLSPEFFQELNVFIRHKMQFMENGTIGWFQILLSGIVANWLIGMAAFLATAARDLTGKVLGTALPVIIFVAGNFQHSVANMGYFSTALVAGAEYTWSEFLIYNLLPASIGNLFGGGLLVALTFSYAYKEEINKNNVPKEEAE
ncbi:formate/nitrite transporter family protein [Pseudalkalibacillus caeni]|uniref:Formate/nitrite transporter family protein n=1 Tax=Exobacillus caeni TaxID=2574798 RepID=A0A5R9F4W2_9BACL|nr:formate/nitrite transporter family protein [Pseudalkalibacillus caeni]TLS38071.1 formate/nitrite transporter family protein [Pseudalkalibacillus caeni]